MIATQHDLQRERILLACRLGVVASAASVDPVAWASTASPRVIPTDGAGYVAGLHRGRLPAVEVFQREPEWLRQSAGGGTMRATWVLRVHVPGPRYDQAASLARAIGQLCLAAIRSDEYLMEGSDREVRFQADPLGYSLEYEVSLAHVFCRIDYETGAVITPGDPVVVVETVGGITLLVEFDNVSPMLVLPLPANHALDNVEVEILTAWDGVGASLSLGTPVDPEAFMAAADIDLTTVATYERDHAVLGPATILAYITPGVGASAGSARVQLTATNKGT